MSGPQQQADHSSDAAATIAAELSSLTAKSNQASHNLCQYVLENVLLHQAAAQQLQVSAAGLVNTGQQLLATSRQLMPQLQQLAAMADSSKQLRAHAEQLKESAAALRQNQASGR